MLTIGKLTPGRASYYCAQLPGGRDEYYTSSREEPGVWLGHAAGRLGLDGRVGPEQFRRVLDATHPADGRPLGVPVTTDHRLAGFDLCLSAPKSVSIAWALAPPDMAERIAAAHDRAVAHTVEALEAEGVRARRGAGGGRSIETNGVVAAAFGHRTSRAGDPQIHTHVVVANLTPDPSGRWSAIDGARVYRWGKTLGYLYQAELRRELTETLGLEWGPVRNGTADLAGVPPSAVEAFSKRTAEIVRSLGGSTDSVPWAVAKTATLTTRAPKASVADLATLRESWRAEAAQLGMDRTTIAALARGHVPALPEPDHLQTRLFGAEGLTAHSSSFDRRDVLQALAAAHPDGAAAPVLRSLADRLSGRPEVVELAGADQRTGPRYTTRELLSVEARLVAGAARRQTAGAGVASPEHLDRAFNDRPTLSDEQRRMITSLTTSGAGVEVVIGRAGAGKTYALDAARAAWEASGHRVVGAALAARAAAELQSGAGIPSTTVDRLLADLDRPGPLSALPARACLVVDEAGMIGTRKLGRLLEHAERLGAKVVLVGDHRQLPEIEAGGALAALARAVPTSELVDNRRQIEAWERDALAELRAGSVPAAFTAYTDAGRITLAAGADEARQTMVDDWWQAHRTGSRAAMYALRRGDVDDLNQRARRHMQHEGRLGPDALQVAGREFAVGDQVLCLRNDRRLGVRNGTASTVAAVNPTTSEITLADGKVLPHDYLADGHLGYSYATTIHKGQGATVDRAFLLGSAAIYREAGYVGLSRARERTDLYVVAPRTAGDTLGADPVVETIRRLGTSRAQMLATEQLEVPSPDRRALDAADRRAVLTDPAPWMAEALGPPPLAGPDRERWGRDAERLAAYRDIYGITDPGDALGPEPADPEQRRAWSLARMTLLEHDRHLEIEQGRSL